MGVKDKLVHAWNAFVDYEEETYPKNWDYGASYGIRQDRLRLRVANEKSILTSIVNTIAVDVSSIDIRHSRFDEQGRYIGEINSSLNECLSVSANIDQEAQSFKRDIAMTMMESGVAAVVPVETGFAPTAEGSLDIRSLRVGEVVQWYPKHIRLNLYNEARGQRQELVLEKKFVAIVENPFYSVMNEPNSTLQRIIRKLSYLDSIDERVGSSKLDMIIQLPYVIKSEAKRAQAMQRKEDIEFQLKDSAHGIAYTDGTEKITQLNRPVENNLLQQLEYLMKELYAQLGISQAVMDGTADEPTMLNYHQRTVKPIIKAITEAMEAKYLSKTARTQGQGISFFRDPFQLVPMADLAEMADKFTRNEIITANEFRGFIGVKPFPDAKADELRNSNMPDNKLDPAKQPLELMPANDNNQKSTARGRQN